VEYEWDRRQAAANLAKHGVDFADAATVFEDERALTTEDVGAAGEQRLVTLGTDAEGRLLVVVYTWREERIRLISARPADRRERREYEAAP
jgi:uncharacterized DUF497 family protein